MNRTKQFISASFLLLSISAFAQNAKTGVSSDPFAKGNWAFDLNRIAAYNQTNIYRNDDKLFEQKGTDLNLQAMYFFTKGLGFGLNYTLSRFHEMQSSTETHSLGAKFQYGTSIGTNTYLYGRFGGGLGWDTDVDHFPGSDNNSEAKTDFNNLNAGIGIPIRVRNGGHAYFTPEILWDQNHWDINGGKEVENTFGIGLKLQTYLSSGDFNCGKKIDGATINSRYNRGSQYIDFNSSGLYGITKSKTTYEGFPGTNELKISEGDLMVHYGYYIADNFAVGAGVGFNSTKRDINSNESTTSEWSIIPNLTYNLPAKNCWNNLFVNVEGGLGATKFKSETIVGYTFTQNFLTYGGGIGFNYMMSPNIALTPKVGYTVRNIENSGNDDKFKRKGPELSFGFRYIF